MTRSNSRKLKKYIKKFYFHFRSRESTLAARALVFTLTFSQHLFLSSLSQFISQINSAHSRRRQSIGVPFQFTHGTADATLSRHDGWIDSGMLDALAQLPLQQWEANENHNESETQMRYIWKMEDYHHILSCETFWSISSHEFLMSCFQFQIKWKFAHCVVFC